MISFFPFPLSHNKRSEHEETFPCLWLSHQRFSYYDTQSKRMLKILVLHVDKDSNS